MKKSPTLLLMAIAMPALLTRCGDSAPPEPAAPEALPAAAETSPSSPEPAAAADPAEPHKKAVYWTEEMLHTEVKYHNPNYAGNGQFQIYNGQVVAVGLRETEVKNLRFMDKIDPSALDLSSTPAQDLGPLRGKPLVELYLEDSQALDLSALRGMPLEKLYLSRTPVRDLSALEGMPLTDLNLVDTEVTDLSPLANCKQLKMLWLTDTPVANIAPLKTVPLISLTLHRTRVTDLSPLSGTGLERLHIGETPVTDLTPLKGMRLTRLVFDPDKITAGMDVARALPLREIGTRFDDGMRDLEPPAAFWAKRDGPKKPPVIPFAP